MIADDPLSLIFPNVFIRVNGVLRQGPVTLKLEGFSITGSIKIKTALYMIREAESRGVAHPGVTTLVESSSGNLGVALSLVCQRRGYRFICVTDPMASNASVSAMEVYGAQVITISKRDSNGGYLQSRLAYIQDLLGQNPSYRWLNQYASRANRTAHYETTAREILAETLAPDYVFVGAGSTGTLMGCLRLFRELSPRTEVVAVEPVGSVSFGGTPARRLIPGIGASRRPELLDPDLVHRVVAISEPDTIRMCHEMAGQNGLLVGGSTGTVLAAVRQMESAIPHGASVVAISPDFGDKYLDTIYNRSWVLRNFGFDPRGGTIPLVPPASPADVGK